MFQVQNSCFHFKMRYSSHSWSIPNFKKSYLEHLLSISNKAVLFQNDQSYSLQTWNNFFKSNWNVQSLRSFQFEPFYTWIFSGYRNCKYKYKSNERTKSTPLLIRFSGISDLEERKKVSKIIIGFTQFSLTY